MKRIKPLHSISTLVALIAVIAGFGTATVVSNVPTGLHELTLSGASDSIDTGVGFFTLHNADSTVRFGFFLANGRFADTRLAFPGLLDARGGIARLLHGKASAHLSHLSTFSIQMSDTARTSVETLFSTALASSGTWKGTLTNNSGTCTSIFDTPGLRFSSTTIQFGDSTASGSQTGDSFPLSNAMRSGDSAASASGPVDIRIAVNVRSGIDSNPNDTMRIIVFNAAGNVAGDSQMIRTAGPASRDTTWQSSGIRLESGVNTIIIVYWDAAQAKYAIKIGRINVGTVNWNVATAGTAVPYVVTSGSPAQGQLSRFDLTVQSSVTPTVSAVQLLDPTGDGIAKADIYASVDLNTSGFDTRLPKTVFAVNLYDAGGNTITKLSGGKFLLVVRYNFAGLTSAQTSNIRLLHRNATTNTWDAVLSSTPDSSTGTLVAYVDEFSEFALGTVNSAPPPPEVDNDNCVISRTIGGTFLSELLPLLRSLRDVFLSTSLGRGIASIYYARMIPAFASA